ncbi:uncharacterized protein LOC127255414 [Andrographis paniculata]|uniref:uncharacterized protein LOC127255414 n=1 Tax=Andrographis paniculata TaxID=175694 RepID=UPI0021E7B906|nr:uncharacterized protein LOC127255414 [Andrographis paniculata]
MLCLCGSLPCISPRLILPAVAPPWNGRSIDRILRLSHEKRTSRRGISVVTRAGPSATSYALVFFLPLSLLAATIFISVRVADKLDEKFFEELAMNEAIKEGEENEDGGGNDEDNISLEQEQTKTRTRNRPKREVEPSSK